MRGMVREEALSRICNKVLRGNWTDHYKCHFLHHFDPFLKLGPFKLEIKLDLPYRAVLHDILNDEEIQHMIDLSKVSIFWAKWYCWKNMIVLALNVWFEFWKKT